MTLLWGLLNHPISVPPPASLRGAVVNWALAMCSPEFMGKECCNRVSDNSDKAAECVRAIGSEAAACSSWRFMAEQCACGAVIVQEEHVGLV